MRAMKKLLLGMTAALGISMMSSAAIAETELTMYYPVAVGGPLTKTVDKIVELSLIHI